ncbi:MAG: hypothetical protein WC942_11445 [Clostridia bacterium]|jgi:hypothetical protein
MNWYKKANKDNFLESDPKNLSFEEIEKLINYSYASIDFLIKLYKELSKITKDIKVGSSFRNIKNLFKYGPYIYAIVWGENIINNKEHFLQIQSWTDSYGEKIGIDVDIYIQKSGFDNEETKNGIVVPTLYKIDENFNLIRTENVEKAALARQNINFLENETNLIKENTARKLEIKKSEKIIEKFYNEALEEAKSNIIIGTMDLKEAIIFLQKELKNNNANNEVIKNSSEILKNWYWKEYASEEEFSQTMEKAMNEVYNSQPQMTEEQKMRQYEYFLDMDPKKEGMGKFINEDMIEKAYNKWGDFYVTVRYNNGRLKYPAKDIVGFLHADIDDDKAYIFENQMNGIRDMYVSQG